MAPAPPTSHVLASNEQIEAVRAGRENFVRQTARLREEARAMREAPGGARRGDSIVYFVTLMPRAEYLSEEAIATTLAAACLAHDPNLTEERIRTVMGTLGLVGEKAVRPIGQLSGGEKARVALATFCLTPCNVLLLDEPTKHAIAVRAGDICACFLRLLPALLLPAAAHSLRFGS